MLNYRVENDWGSASINITRVGNFTAPPYNYTLTSLESVERIVTAGAGIGKIHVQQFTGPRHNSRNLIIKTL